MNISRLLPVGLCLAACNSAPAEPAGDARAPTGAVALADVPLAEPDAKLLAPEKATEKAPDTFKVKFATTRGEFTVEAHRDWAPNGADRFYNLVRIGFFSDVVFFRVVDGFVAQFGIHGHPKVAKAWQNANIQDEPVKEGNRRGRLVFAKGGPNSRSTQFFINFKDNASLDSMGFPAFAEVVAGMGVVDSLNKEYGEQPTSKQGELTRFGNAWLKGQFPNLDSIQSATLLPSAEPAKTVEPGKTAEPTTTAEPSKTAEPVKPAEPSKPGAPVKPGATPKAGSPNQGH